MPPQGDALPLQDVVPNQASCEIRSQATSDGTNQASCERTNTVLYRPSHQRIPNDVSSRRCVPHLEVSDDVSSHRCVPCTSEIQNDVSSQRCVPYDEVSDDASWEIHDDAYLSVYCPSTVPANSPTASRPVPDASAQSTAVTYFTGVVKSQRCPRPECQDEIPPMGGPLSPSASEEIPPRVVRSDRPACDALAAPSQDAAATARPAMPSVEDGRFLLRDRFDCITSN